MVGNVDTVQVMIGLVTNLELGNPGSPQHPPFLDFLSSKLKNRSYLPWDVSSRLYCRTNSPKHAGRWKFSSVMGAQLPQCGCEVWSPHL